jgi:alpha-beta hydrolase superfamily lysophospholipase
VTPFLVVAGVVLVAMALVLDRLALVLIRPRKRTHARNVRTLPFEVREHSFQSLGQELKGWFVVPAADCGGPAVVLVHGWGSSHGRMTHLAQPLLEAGHPVFLFDIRYHGDSPDAPYVTARHFRDDTLAATREVRANFPHRPLVLMGHSMGGSAAILAVVEGAPVDGLVTIAAPADLWGVWAHFFDQKGLPGTWIVRVFNPFWRYRAGVPFRTLRPDRRASEVKVPFLILHGDRDTSVDVSHARILARSAGVTPVVLEREGHNDLLAKPALHERVSGFLDAIPVPARDPQPNS